MGRKTAVLIKGFRAAKCLTLLKVTTARIKVARNKRSASAKQMRGEIAQLIKSGQDSQVYITKADALIKQENLVSVYDLLDQYCHAIVGRIAAIEMHRTCPADMKEPIASLIYAAARCIELTELPAIKDAFVAKYGKEFAAAAATELSPDCGVNTRIVELLSAQPATGDQKLNLMKEICKDYSIDWKPGETMAASAAKETLGEGVGETSASTSRPSQATSKHGASSKVGFAEPAMGHSEYWMEVQAKETRGEGVGETGPATLRPSQATSKHGASSKVGFAEAVMPTKVGSEVLFATDVSKPLEKKQSISLEEDATKKVRASASVGTTASSKDSLKENVQPSEFEEEDARKLRARILQSLKGGSFNELDVDADAPESEAEKITQDILKPGGVQDGTSDSDSDSFVSVEDGRLEDDVQLSSHESTSIKERFRENSDQNLTEAHSECPNVSRQEENTDLEANNENSDGATDSCKDMVEDGNFSCLDLEILPQGMSLKLDDKMLISEQDSGKEWRNNSLSKGKLAEAQLAETVEKCVFKDKKELNFCRMSSKKSSYEGDMINEKVIQESSDITKLDSSGIRKLIEGQLVEEVDEYGDINKKVAEKLLEEVDEDRDINEKAEKLLEEVDEDSDLNEKVAEKLFVEMNDVEDLQREVSWKGKSAECPAKDSLEKQFSERGSLKAKKMGKSMVDESCLSNGDTLQVASAVEVQDLEAIENDVGECPYDANKVNSSAKDESRLHGFEIAKHQSSFEVSDDGVFSAVSKDPLPRPQTALELGGETSTYLTAEGISVEELVGAASLSSLGMLENSQDFAAAAKAIAEEAARLAVRDYANRIAVSNTIAFHSAEPSRSGVPCEEKKVAEAEQSHGHREYLKNDEVLLAGDGIKPETDPIKEGIEEEKTLKAETPLDLDDACKHELLDINEISGSNSHEDLKSTVAFKLETVLNLDEDDRHDPLDSNETIAKNGNEDYGPTVADAIDGGTDDLNPSTTTKMTTESELEYINPFATRTTSDIVENANGSLLKYDDTIQLRQTADFGQHNDHLNIFFQRKMLPLISEDDLVFAEKRENFSKPKPTFVRKETPQVRFDTKMTSLHENLFSTPDFETSADGQKAVFKDSFDASKHFVYDKRDGSSFKSPVFDEMPEANHTASSFDFYLDNISVGLSDSGSQSMWSSTKGSGTFDPELESEEEESSLEGSAGLPLKGQLKWISKKPVNPAEHETTGKVNPSHASEDLSGKPMSRRSGRQPKAYNDNEHNVNGTSQHTSTIDFLKQDKSDSGRIDADNVWPGVRNSSALSQQSSGPPKWVTSQVDESSPSETDWGRYTRKKVSSMGTTLPSTRLGNKHKLSFEDFCFSDENDLPSRSAGSSINRITDTSPPRQLTSHGIFGIKDDVVVEKDGYEQSYNVPGKPKNSQHDIVEDDHNKLFGGKYMHSPQTSELHKRTSDDCGFESTHRQHFEQHGETGIGPEYTDYKQDLGVGSRTKPVSSRQNEKYSEDEELYLISRYKPTLKIGEVEYESSQKPSITNVYQLEKDQNEGTEKMSIKYEHYRDNEGDSLKMRPIPSRPNQTARQERHQTKLSTTGIENTDSLDLQNRNKSKISKFQAVEQDEVEGHEAGKVLETGQMAERQTLYSGKMALLSSGFSCQQNHDALGSNYSNHEEGTAQGDRMPTRRSFNTPKWSDIKEEQHVEWNDEESDNRVKTFSSKPLPGALRHKKAVEERYPMQSHNPSIAKEGEHQALPDSKLYRLSDVDDSEVDLQFRRQNLTSDYEEKIQGNKQQVVTDTLQNSMTKGEPSKDGQLSPSFKYKQEEKKDFHLYSGASASKDRQPLKEGVSEEQGKMRTENEPLQLNGVDEVGAIGRQPKLRTKSQPLTQQQSPSTDLPLEMSISDPMVLATIPPPVKKPSSSQLSATVKAESSASDTPQKKPLEGKVENLPKKPPTLQDLAANFEALRRARKGE